ncbi:hypothetical protein P3T76_013915 [Phytophthora citrophthora]|uniref:Uncharacterized protein n=1 Tax=Phytophthora citrophthora TaxID=4793 RepID=A0AAD9LBM1_9STRA|nr:hypothetical protein P3T76_013915 [Phytophthora citrophthora]
MQASPIKPSALAIPPEEYVHTPGSSVTSSPAESCVSGAEKQLKPWERSSSVTSSVNSSETIDAEEEEAEHATDSSYSIDTRAQALKLQTHLRGVQKRLDGLQRLMHEAALHSSFLSRSQADPQPRIIIAAEANVHVAASESPDLQRRTLPAQKQRVDNFVQTDSTSSGEWAEDAPNDEANDSRDDQQDSSSNSSEEDGPPAITALLNRIKTLQAQLKEATDENEQLQRTVHRLEEQNARLQAQTACAPAEGAIEGPTPWCDQESSCAKADGASKGLDESFSRLETAIFGEPSAFQKVMDEDLAVLKDHERCQRKLHELWDTVRVLRTFVETYELEKNAMKIQRDDAIADANSADAENVRLASSSNPQQKIKYLEQVKKDNQTLRKKNRALNMRIARQAAKFIRERNGCSLLDDGEISIDTITTLDDTLVSDETSTVRSGEEILRSMRNRSGVLEQRLESLRLARQELPEVKVDNSDEKASVSTKLCRDSAPVIGQYLPATNAR